MTRLGKRPSSGRPRRRWPGAIFATSLLLTVIVWVADGSDAQTAPPPFRVEVSKTTDLVSGETIEINVRTDPGTIIDPAGESEVRTCRSQEADYTPAQFDNVGTETTCVVNRAQLSEFDNSLDNDFLYRFPDNGPEQGRRAITVLRPGQGPATWKLGGVQHSLTCDKDHPCRLVFRVRTKTGNANPVTTIYSSPQLELGYRPETGVAGCDGPADGAIQSVLPDRLQEAWLDWTRSICRTSGGDAPTNAFFQSEGEALTSFAGGSRDLAYSAVGYRPGFEVPTERPMVATPVALNAVVVAVGGGYVVDDGTWPTTFPRPATEFRLTNAELATLMGQLQSAYLSQYGDAVVARNPFVLGPNFLFNAAVGAPVAVTGPQSTTLFATTFFDTLAPQQWTDRNGVDRGVETDLNKAVPTHSGGAMDLKTGRPDLARIVYKNLYELGTYYVLTDLATATELGLTPVTLQNAAGEWVEPTPETLAAAVPSMQEQDDGTLVPNPNTTTGYPLTFVEYAMAPARPLVTDRCQPRTASQELLDDWLEYVTTDGQAQLSGGGLAPLTPALATQAAGRRDRVGASPSGCTTTPTTSTTAPSGGTTTTLPPASVTDPGSSLGGDGSSSGSDLGGGGADDVDDLTGNGDARPSRASTPSSRRQSVRAAHEAEIELPDLQGIRSINTLGPPLALLVIVVLSTFVALSTAGYPAPAAVARLPGQARRGVRGARAAASRLRHLRRARPAAGDPAS